LNQTTRVHTQKKTHKPHTHTHTHTNTNRMKENLHYRTQKKKMAYIITSANSRCVPSFTKVGKEDASKNTAKCSPSRFFNSLHVYFLHASTKLCKWFSRLMSWN